MFYCEIFPDPHLSTAFRECLTRHFFFLPVEGNADEDVAGEEEAEDPEEGEHPAEQVPRRPHHRGSPADLQRHHQESYLEAERICVNYTERKDLLIASFSRETDEMH